MKNWLIKKLFRIKVTVYFKGGSVMTFKCTDFSTIRLSSKVREVKWDGAKEKITFDVNEIAAISAVRVLRFI